MSASKRRADIARAKLLIAALTVRFPLAFSLYERNRKPLKLGISADVVAASAKGIASGKLTAQQIGRALSYYAGNIAYLKSCKAGAARLDLQGKIAGHVTADEAAYAAARIALIAQARKPNTSPTAAKKLPRSAADRTGRGNSTSDKRHERNPQSYRNASPV